MQGFTRHILRMVFAAAVISSATSCVCEDLQDEHDESAVPADHTYVNITFNLPMGRANESGDTEYIVGEGYENYIDYENREYRIYFFDNDNKYVGRFNPMLFGPVEGGNGTRYEVFGEVAKAVIGLSDFKIVVIANWPTYPDQYMYAGTTTIDDLCNAEKSQFNCLSNFDLDPAQKRLIPLFGIHHFKGVTIEKNKYNSLTEPITLLRAMAKIEIVVDIDNMSMASIKLRGYNKKGYSAPQGVDEQSDYDHNGNWTQDYLKTPHLVGGKNDDNQENAVIPLLCKNHTDGTRKETWVAYVPEYRNVATDVSETIYKSRLELHLDTRDYDKPYYIYFADYDTAGKMVADSYFDILRNNCYRFTVTLVGGGFAIKVNRWENAYDNHFIFN